MQCGLPLLQIFFLAFGGASLANAWVADRVNGSDIWVLTCRDETTLTRHWGADGPSFNEAIAQCKAHGGISRQPSIGPTKYQVFVGPSARQTSTVSIGDLVSKKAITRENAISLTSTIEFAQ